MGSLAKDLYEINSLAQTKASCYMYVVKLHKYMYL